MILPLLFAQALLPRVSCATGSQFILHTWGTKAQGTSSFRPQRSLLLCITFQETMLEGTSSITFFDLLLGFFPHNLNLTNIPFFVVGYVKMLGGDTVVEYHQYIFDDKDCKHCLKIYYLRQQHVFRE